jgi:hypothetical protein
MFFLCLKKLISFSPAYRWIERFQKKTKKIPSQRERKNKMSPFWTTFIVFVILGVFAACMYALFRTICFRTTVYSPGKDEPNDYDYDDYDFDSSGNNCQDANMPCSSSSSQSSSQQQKRSPTTLSTMFNKEMSNIAAAKKREVLSTDLTRTGLFSMKFIDEKDLPGNSWSGRLWRYVSSPVKDFFTKHSIKTFKSKSKPSSRMYPVILIPGLTGTVLDWSGTNIYSNVTVSPEKQAQLWPSADAINPFAFKTWSLISS